MKHTFGTKACLSEAISTNIVFYQSPEHVIKTEIDRKMAFIREEAVRCSE